MDEVSKNLQAFNCPVPLSHHETIQLGHGSGGTLTHELIKKIFQKHLGNEILNPGNDAAILPARYDEKLVVSTDAHIVSPLIFPGGDIGRLAVCGTVNDVAMMGARVESLTASFILEEGLSIEQLEIIVASMAEACQEAGVKIVAGDTKVTERGNSDGLFISTAGFGWLSGNHQIAGDLAQPGDAVILSGPIGNHGVAIAQARGNLGFSSSVQSDVAPLNGMITSLLEVVPDVHVMRDPTRGGLATTLVEIAKQSGVSIELKEDQIPVDRAVRSVCDMLGLDPLYMANEGKLILILPSESAQKALHALQNHKYGRFATLIGYVLEKSNGKVWLRTTFGTTRILDMLSAELLPRIC